MYLISLLFIVEYLYLIHLVLRACSCIYLTLYLCVIIRSYDLLWIHKVIHLSSVWVTVIILLLFLFWTSTPAHISYMLISKHQLFCPILLLNLNWFHMTKGTFLMSFVQSIYLSIGTLLVQSINQFITLYWSNLLIYLLHLQFSHLYLISLFNLIVVLDLAPYEQRHVRTTAYSIHLSIH